MKEIQRLIGDKIRFLRKQRGLSIEELAYKSDIHNNYLGDLERGRRNPSVESLQKIAKGLGVGVGEIFGSSLKDLKKSGFQYGKPKDRKFLIYDKKIKDKDWKTFLKVAKIISRGSGKK